MANITILPLASAGIKAPLNLLTKLFANRNDNRNLLYPIDLANNPSYNHAVQFSIHEYDFPNVEAARNATIGAAISGVAANRTGGAEAIVKGIISSASSTAGVIGASALAAFNNPGESGNAIDITGKVFQASTYKPSVRGASLCNISLYMPDTLNTTFDSNYTQVSMTDTLGPLGYVGAAIADFKSANGNEEQKVNLYATNIARGIIQNQVGRGFGGVLAQAFKAIPNPQLQLIYKGINLRQFQLEFIFTPVSNQEAQAVEQIINNFIFYSVPDVNPNSTTGQFLIPPQVFRIKFAFTGKSGIAGTIQTIFRNTLTNVIGAQLTGALTGSNPTTQIANASKARVFEIGDCVLSNVNVDYAPNGWAAYNDGFPIQTRLTLQFKEMDIVTKRTLREQGKDGADRLNRFDEGVRKDAQDAFNRNIP